MTEPPGRYRRCSPSLCGSDFTPRRCSPDVEPCCTRFFDTLEADSDSWDDSDCSYSLSDEPECVPAVCSDNRLHNSGLHRQPSSSPPMPSRRECTLNTRPSPVGGLVDELCHQIDTLQLRPQPMHAPGSGTLRLPEHDRRILQRMAAKRRDQRRRTEAAHLAHERWRLEQRDRHVHAQHQADQIALDAQQSRTDDRQRFDDRRTALWQRDRNRTRAIRHELLSRDDRLADRLDAVRGRQAYRMMAKHADDSVRLAEAGWRRATNDTERMRRHRECYAQLTERMLAAQVARGDRTEQRRRRVIEQNDAEATEHADRLRDVQRGEREHAAGVRRRMAERTLRGADFVRHRSDGVLEQRSRARWTAELRELVRNSSTMPDGGGGSLVGAWMEG